MRRTWAHKNLAVHEHLEWGVLPVRRTWAHKNLGAHEHLEWGVQPVHRTWAHMNLGAHEHQRSRLKLAIMHEFFIAALNGDGKHDPLAYLTSSDLCFL